MYQVWYVILTTIRITRHWIPIENKKILRGILPPDIHVSMQLPDGICGCHESNMNV